MGAWSPYRCALTCAAVYSIGAPSLLLLVHAAPLSDTARSFLQGFTEPLVAPVWAAIITLEDAIRLLPLSQNTAPKPLPDQARLVIDSIGVDAPIVFNVPDNNDLIYQRLEDGVVHYSTTAKPGNPGSGIILGHSSAYPCSRPRRPRSSAATPCRRDRGGTSSAPRPLGRCRWSD